MGYRAIVAYHQGEEVGEEMGDVGENAT